MHRSILAARSARLALLFASAATLAACGGGGGGGGDTPPPPPPATLGVTADHDTSTAGGAAVGLHAAVTHSTAVPTWTLEGPGSLSASTGNDVQYVPPAAESLDTAATVTVTATIAGAPASAVHLSLATSPGHTWAVGVAGGEWWSSVAWGGDRFVAVGYGGVLAESTDGRNWTRHDDAAAGQDIVALTYGSAGWVAVSWRGRVLTSGDGVHWTTAATLPDSVGIPDYIAPRTAASGSGRYVVSGETNTYASTDGVHWTAGDTGTHADVLAYGNGVFVSGNRAGLFQSTDGLHWTAPGGGFQGAMGLTFGDGQFVASSSNGIVATSPDGIAWTFLDLSDIHGTRAYAGARWFALGRTMAVAANASGPWTSLDSDPWNRFIAVAQGGPGFVRVAGTGGMAFSSDGTTWTEVAASRPDVLAWTVSNGTELLAIQDNGAASSLDGLTWTANGPVDATYSDSSFQVLGLAHGGASWVAVGAITYSRERFPEIHTSTDGVTWTSSGWTDNSPGASITFDGSVFLSILDDGQVVTSPTGVTWSVAGTVAAPAPLAGGYDDSRYWSSSSVVGFATGLGRTVAVDRAGRVLASTDHGHWTTVAQAASPLDAVAFDGARFVALGDAGVALASTDGLTWTAANTGASMPLRAIAALPGEFVAVGDGGALFTSGDGLAWHARASGTTRDLQAVVVSGGRFVATGLHGVVVTSDH